MLQEKLTTYDYYLKKMSLFMRNHGIDDLVYLYVDVLKNLDATIDTLIDMLASIPDSDMALIQQLSDSESDLLDKVGAMFGVNRRFNLTLEDVTYSIELNNLQFQILIKTRMMQNNYDGTRQQSLDYYSKLASMTNGLIDIKLLDDESESAHCLVYMNDNAELSNNVRRMFLAGMLTLKSMGISYECIIGDIANVAIFDSPLVRLGWDRGLWS